MSTTSSPPAGQAEAKAAATAAGSHRISPTSPGGPIRSVPHTAASKHGATPAPHGESAEVAAAVPAASRLPTGVKRLDALLGGGLPAGAAGLLYGPPFLGKETLARRAFLANLQAGIPAILILTNTATADVRAQLAHEPGYQAAEKKHLARYIDTYSVSIGAQDKSQDATYLDGALDLNGIAVAVNQAQKDIIGEHSHHLLVLDSVSTLIAYSTAQTAFRFLQTLIGRTRRVGATGLYLMDHGMHTDADIQMFKHLMTGVIEVRDQSGKPHLQAQGLGAPQGLGWVEYRFTESSFDITGSFAAGRIR